MPQKIDPSRPVCLVVSVVRGLTLNAVLEAFGRLKVWERNGERAPHKPLLALLALGRWASGERGPIRYSALEEPLKKLLIEFGPPRRQYHPEFPFWYLKNDDVWQVTPDQGYQPRKGHSSPSAKQLREADATGQFSEAVRLALERNPAAVTSVVRQLLESHFPPSYRDDILAAVGISLDAPSPAKAVRDRAFREAVLVAYEFVCAVCRVGVRLGNIPIGIEAAHIWWHSCGGPDEVSNGLCLCPLHHKLFDRGALSLSPDGLRAWVSEQVNGPSAEEVLFRFHETPVARPNRKEHHPSAEFVAWHHQEVFRGRPRS